MYNKINLMLPTYCRSTTKLPVFIDSALATAAKKENIYFTFCVNVNDESTLQYLAARPWPHPEKYCVVSENEPSPHLAKYFNAMYEKTVWKDEEMLVTEMGDDMVFKTPAWDTRILNEVNRWRGVGVFWANDDYIGKDKCPVNMFLSRKFIEATDRPFMCEKFAADWIDKLWYYVGQYTGTLHYMPNVIIAHEHSSKVGADDTFNRLRPVQLAAWDGAREFAKQYAHEVADTLKKKGVVG